MCGGGGVLNRFFAAENLALGSVVVHQPGYAMNSSKSDYHSKQLIRNDRLILQFSAISTEILMVLKIHVNA